MKKLYVLCLLFLAIVCSKSFATITHDNNVFIGMEDGGSPPMKASFLVTRHSVTSGQPFDHKDNTFLPVHQQHCSVHQQHCNGTDLTIRAGRKKSPQVFNDLKQWDVDVSNVPSGMELNFAVLGTLTFTYFGSTYTCNNIALTQGSAGLANRWYLFSVNGGTGSYYGNKYTSFNCSDQDGSLRTFITFWSHFGSGNQNKFFLFLVNLSDL